MAFVRNVDQKYALPAIENLTGDQLDRLENELFTDGVMDWDLDASLVAIIAAIVWIDEHVLLKTAHYILVSWCAPGWSEDDMDFTDPVIREAHLTMDNLRLSESTRSAARRTFYAHAESPMEVLFGTSKLVPANLRGRRLNISFMSREQGEVAIPGDFLAVSVDDNGVLIGIPEP